MIIDVKPPFHVIMAMSSGDSDDATSAHNHHVSERIGDDASRLHFNLDAYRKSPSSSVVAGGGAPFGTGTEVGGRTAIAGGTRSGGFDVSGGRLHTPFFSMSRRRDAAITVGHAEEMTNDNLDTPAMFTPTTSAHHFVFDELDDVVGGGSPQTLSGA